MFSRGGIEWQPCIPSRFLSELPPAHLEDLGSGLYYSAPNPNTRTSWKTEVDEILASTYAPQPQTSSLRPGVRIFHQKFGYGTILSADGDHLHISFEKAGQKKVMADYVEAV